MSFEEQIMSKDKYPEAYFQCQMEAIVFINPSNLFHNMHSF